MIEIGSLLQFEKKLIVIILKSAVTKSVSKPLDIVLDSFYCFKDKRRDGNVTLILDKIQRMNMDEGAPVDVIFSTGRKLNIPAFLASQRYSDDKDKLGRIEKYCGKNFPVGKAILGKTYRPPEVGDYNEK